MSAVATTIGTTPWYDDLRRRSGPALRRVREEAYGVGGYVGQDSFMVASDILALARAAGVRPGCRVLDLCCGTGGPALYLAEQTKCRVVGVDLSQEGLRQARATARRHITANLAFVAAEAMRLPLSGDFDVVLMLETMLAVEDKAGLLREIRRLLGRGCRFGLTLEEGRPLSDAERRQVPAGDRVWLVTETDFIGLSHASGYLVREIDDHSADHADVAGRLARGLRAERDAVAGEVGRDVCDEMIAAHEWWSGWLGSGRVRKLAIVLERAA